MIMFRSTEKLRQRFRTTGVLGAFAALLCLTPDAAALVGSQQYEYINNSVGTPAISGTDATIDAVSAFFDESDNTFIWTATFSANTANDLPTGFTLVVNDGPMPKRHLGELAVLYFEAEEQFKGNLLASSSLTAYAYNGASSATAHRTSDFRPNPLDPPDPIASSRNGSLNVIDTEFQEYTDMGREVRFMRVEFDATPILNHMPLQPSVQIGEDQVTVEEDLSWYGIGFSQTIGIWFHPFNKIAPSYVDDINDPDYGFLELGAEGDGWRVVRNNYGFFDVDNLQARLVPEPTSAALLLLTGIAALRRRR
ncbi:MAG: PEP-CTERM sorting domain-containing protein [Planctomycetota bacterium]